MARLLVHWLLLCPVHGATVPWPHAQADWYNPTIPARTGVDWPPPLEATYVELKMHDDITASDLRDNNPNRPPDERQLQAVNATRLPQLPHGTSDGVRSNEVGISDFAAGECCRHDRNVTPLRLYDQRDFRAVWVALLLWILCTVSRNTTFREPRNRRRVLSSRCAAVRFVDT